MLPLVCSMKLHKQQGFVEATGDTTVIDISSLPDYRSDRGIVIREYRVQAGTDNPSVVLFKEGPNTVKNLVLAGTGTGVDKDEKEWILPPDTDLIFNASTADRVYYTLEYSLR